MHNAILYGSLGDLALKTRKYEIKFLPALAVRYPLLLTSFSKTSPNSVPFRTFSNEDLD